jgi:hypothetical protein
MKNLLLFVVLLALPINAHAQSIGCFLDFTTGLCDGGDGRSYGLHGNFIELQQKYGFVAAQMILTYYDEWEGCSSDYDELVDQYKTLQANADSALSSQAFYQQELELSLERAVKKIKRLRRKLRR